MIYDKRDHIQIGELGGRDVTSAEEPSLMNSALLSFAHMEIFTVTLDLLPPLSPRPVFLPVGFSLLLLAWIPLDTASVPRAAQPPPSTDQAASKLVPLTYLQACGVVGTDFELKDIHLWPQRCSH